MIRHSIKAVMLTILLCGCGGDSGAVYSCDLRTAMMKQPYCQEYAGLTTTALVMPYQSACTGTWSAAACTHTGSLGGCRSAPTMGITITNWFFADDSSGVKTADDVKQQCSGGGQTYVMP